jgi:hypothetical protein
MTHEKSILEDSPTRTTFPSCLWAAPFPSVGFVVKLTNSGQFANGGYTMRLGAWVNGLNTFVSNQPAPFGPAGPHQQVYRAGMQYTDGPNDTTDVFVAKVDEGFPVVERPDDPLVIFPVPVGTTAVRPTHAQHFG